MRTFWNGGRPATKEVRTMEIWHARRHLRQAGKYTLDSAPVLVPALAIVASEAFLRPPELDIPGYKSGTSVYARTIF